MTTDEAYAATSAVREAARRAWPDMDGAASTISVHERPDGRGYIAFVEVVFTQPRGDLRGEGTSGALTGQPTVQAALDDLQRAIERRAA